MRSLTLFLFLAVTVELAQSQQMPARVAARDTSLRSSAIKPDVKEKTSVVSSKPVSSESAEEKSGSRGTAAQVPAKKEIAPLSSFEFWLSVIILAFTLVIMITEVWLIRSGTLAVTADSAVRVVLVTLIIGGTMFLIASGYSNDQIAPAMGLFGTIAGYLLGKSSGPTEDGSQKKT